MSKINYYEFLNKKLFPKRKALSNKHGWAFPMEDRIHSLMLQQEQIAFGTETEKVLSEVFSSIPYVKVLNSHVTFQKYDRKKSAIIDHVLELGNVILVLEQKLKDNHDSTKNTGQFDDLIEKMNAVKRAHPDKTVIPVMYFLTDTQKGAKKKFTTLLSQYGGRVCYGKELFDVFFTDIADELWETLDTAINELQRKEPTVLDYDRLDVINDVRRTISTDRRAQNRLKKMLSDEIFVNDVLPSISKKGRFKEQVFVTIDGYDMFNNQ